MIQEIGKIFNKIREIEIRYVNKKVIRFVNKQQSWVIKKCRRRDFQLLFIRQSEKNSFNKRL